jgi:hypothetical protein
MAKAFDEKKSITTGEVDAEEKVKKMVHKPQETTVSTHSVVPTKQAITVDDVIAFVDKLKKEKNKKGK